MRRRSWAWLTSVVLCCVVGCSASRVRDGDAGLGAHDAAAPDDAHVEDAGRPTCDDGRRNGSETGVDCGGPDCASCATATGSVTPVAACARGFMYQGRQDAFEGAAGTTCSGSVAIALLPVPGDTIGAAFCFARHDGELVCEGRIGARDFSLDAPAGVPDVAQTLAMGWDDLCVLERSGRVWCIGATNAHGQLGTGDTAPVTSFTRWAPESAIANEVAALGTGTGDSLCALTRGAELHCVGWGMGPGADPSLVPVRVARDVAAFYQAGDGRVHIRETGGAERVYDPSTDTTRDEPFVPCRVSAARSEYLVTSPGIVDGSSFGPMPMARACDLHDDGIVRCGLGVGFAGEPVLALGANMYFEDGYYGVREDGAVLDHLGTIVAPPGSARVPRCE